uniref:Uncharacterized protein n=1 Tax=Triticum urartu TaxID=4572 RepID=A0A8R7QRI4_TRIUA
MMALLNGCFFRKTFNWRGSIRRECVASSKRNIWWDMRHIWWDTTRNQMHLFWLWILACSCLNLTRCSSELFLKAQVAGVPRSTIHTEISLLQVRVLAGDGLFWTCEHIRSANNVLCWLNRYPDFNRSCYDTVLTWLPLKLTLCVVVICGCKCFWV